MTKSEKKDQEKEPLKDKETEKKEKEETPEEKLKTVQDKLLRSMAEIENQRRRFEKEKQEAFEFGSFNFAAESLSLIDNMDRAITSFKNDENLKKNKDLDKFLEYITIIDKDLINIFEKNRIKKIDTKNKKFDPNLHQAMSEIEDESKDTGSILQEIQSGYMLGERLLRPALVNVAKKKTAKKEEKNQKKEDK